ncbi:hypothetical protein Glove_271g81 [Diversispora epigaea]|uniref:Uncharacterized protein n=1 Tax=Diversispora epigaea TaxID=1348612 RepID=A0A397I9P4_9GLOM|nr:hypothetical protein Glove_271g81 [Diversispora epigaea]
MKQIHSEQNHRYGNMGNILMGQNPNVTSLNNELWVKPVLSLRIIYPNGTVSEIDKDLEIQDFNWHITTSPGGDYLDPVNIFALQKGYLLVRYFNASNPNDVTTYEEWGCIIGWNDTLYDKVNFGKAYIQNDVWDPTAADIVSNVDTEKGFLRIVRNETFFEWQQYTIDYSFNLIKLLEGIVAPPQNEITALNVMGTIGEGYSIIMGNSTSTNSSNPLEIRASVYSLTKGYYDKQFGTPKMLYQLSLVNITISKIFCFISSTGVGHVCALDVTQGDVNSYNSSNHYYVKLNFLSSGTVAEPSKELPRLPSNTTTGWLVESIPYGGYLFYSYFLDANSDTNVFAYYFNEYSNEPVPWDLSEPSILSLRGVLIIMSNNTMLLSQIEDFNTWSFLTTDIPKFTENSDNGYLNLRVNSTSPSINANISTLTNNITITYYEQVELSAGNISIYQINNNDNNIIRQFVNGITIDNDFVRSKTYGEPLMGIYENIWKFKTNPSEETFADTVSRVLRLTVEGTKYYENLNSTGKGQFFRDLHLALSKIIPVDIRRLSSNEKTQVDSTISHQILISLNIESPKEGRSVASIVDDLNDMITYKSMTFISLFPTTKYLDEDFGFRPKQNLWNKYKWRFLGVVLALAILVVLFLLAQKKESKGRNMAILQLGLIIFDFIMDVLFVSKNGKVAEVLYIPSVIFLTVPIGINTIWAFKIISDENKSKTFLDWFTQHEKVASVFTILSSADIETLNIPQFIIQLLYHYSVVTYDIIPLLALVSSCLSLLINIVGRLFQAINSCRHGTLKYDSKQNQDDVESLQQLQTPTTERNYTSDESISHSIDVNVKEEKEKK